MLRGVAVGAVLLLAGCATASPPANAIWMQDERTGAWCYAKPATDWAATCPGKEGYQPKPWYDCDSTWCRTATIILQWWNDSGHAAVQSMNTMGKGLK